MSIILYIFVFRGRTYRTCQAWNLLVIISQELTHQVILFRVNINQYTFVLKETIIPITIDDDNNCDDDDEGGDNVYDNNNNKKLNSL